MKTVFNKLLTSLCIVAVALGSASCGRDKLEFGKKNSTGTLSFMKLSVGVSEEVDEVSRATDPSTFNYIIRIYNASGEQVGSDYIYGQLPEAITLLTGSYTLKIQSQANIPAAEFEAPVYGAEQSFEIVENQTTNLGTITCKLINIKVSVAYNQTMAEAMGDDCNVRVTIGDGSLDFSKDESQCGYFAAPEASNAMTVKFTGTVNGSYSSMTKAFTDVKAGQWRKITFILNINDEGNASFDIQIEDWCDEEELGGNIDHEETVIGPDPEQPAEPDDPANPDAPKVVYKGGEVPTDPIVVSAGMELSFQIEAPKLIDQFSVDIASDNPDFVNDVLSTGVSPLDLINPTEDQIGICTLFGLPYGEQVAGKDAVDFVLTNAIVPLMGFPGTHTFTLTITDKEGNKTVCPITMKVNE